MPYSNIDLVAPRAFMYKVWRPWQQSFPERTKTQVTREGMESLMGIK